jgi:hypothetical protein
MRPCGRTGGPGARVGIDSRDGWGAAEADLAAVSGSAGTEGALLAGEIWSVDMFENGEPLRPTTCLAGCLRCRAGEAEVGSVAWVAVAEALQGLTGADRGPIGCNR